MMQLSEIVDAVDGVLIGPDATIRSVTIDSRADCHDALFVALRGDHFDGHDFVAAVKEAGAAGVMVELSETVVEPRLLVQDTHLALKQLAAWWRQKFNIPLIGITGSVGKTTVKEMVGSVCAQAGSALVTKGNFNNEIGLPLTLLRISSEHQFAVIEMGMNHAGEIARLSKIAKPTIALINNAGAAHLEGLGSVEAVAKAKGEIFECLAADGTAVINADDPFAALWKELAGDRHVITFGVEQPADVSASYQLNVESISMSVTLPESAEILSIDLPLQGKHSVMNVLATIAVGLAAGIRIEKIVAGLEQYRSVSGRMHTQQFGEIRLIDDTYNANPVSVRAAMEVLAQYPQSTLIIGDMAELGTAAKREHEKLGILANSLGIDQLFAVGHFAEDVVRDFEGAKHSFATQQDLNDFLKTNAPEGAVLVKGSRSAQMENVVTELKKHYGQVEEVSAEIRRGES